MTGEEGGGLDDGGWRLLKSTLMRCGGPGFLFAVAIPPQWSMGVGVLAPELSGPLSAPEAGGVISTPRKSMSIRWGRPGFRVLVVPGPGEGAEALRLGLRLSGEEANEPAAG